MTFNNQNCLIIGGTNGIGLTLAHELSMKGVNVIIVGRNEESGKQAENDIGNDCKFFQCDISDTKKVKQLFEKIKEEYGVLHLAVNNAGVTSPRSPVIDMDLDVWNKVININLNGTASCLKYELEIMSQHAGGSIVNVSSCAGVLPIPYQASYSVSKAGVNCLTKIVAIENATDIEGRFAVRINAVAPGPTLGGMNTPEKLASNKKSTEQKLAVTALKRMAEPLEIVNSIIFLLSDKASYITVTILDVDGGYSCGKFS